MDARIENFYWLLKNKEEATLRELLEQTKSVDTPLFGFTNLSTNFDKFISQQTQWVAENVVNLDVFNVIKSESQIVVEFILYLKGGEIDLPVALWAKGTPTKPESMRIYHSTWPMTRSHRIRSPIVESNNELEEPLALEVYMNALFEGDSEAILEQFTKDGYVREPSGSKFKHQGAAKRRKFYLGALKNGGITLTPCSVTFNGVSCAVEYICSKWGQFQIDPQAGLAVYDIVDEHSLSAARIYDDINPPL
ncbi:MAG: hypothetical protein IH840_01265 [Candidatus Heimdallarchaeota archaeon]|nr:hypothetical protein [Candidatus Heimdallarchaeota archaeon]